MHVLKNGKNNKLADKTLFLIAFFFFCSQHVERLVKMVSTAATEGSSYDVIHQWCLNAQESYEKTPTAASKKHFVERAQNV